METTTPTFTATTTPTVPPSCIICGVETEILTRHNECEKCGRLLAIVECYRCKESLYFVNSLPVKVGEKSIFFHKQCFMDDPY